MADAGEAMAAGYSDEELWNSSRLDPSPDHPLHRDDQAVEKSLSEQLQNFVLKLVNSQGDGNNGDNEGDASIASVALDDGGGGDRGLEDEEKENETAETVRDEYAAHPLRPGAGDCSYYLRTGTCKFGPYCKFNHPAIRRNLDAQDKVKEKDVLEQSTEFIERTGQVECKYYMTAGGCKFGNACRYKHTNLKASEPSDVELNFLGLPLRLGQKECQYYMRTGSCKYAANCWFNHPDPTDLKESDFSTSLNHSTSPAPQLQLQQGGWEDTGPFMPTVSPPKQEVPVEYFGSNPYQAQYDSAESSMPLPSSYPLSYSMRDNGLWSISSEYPERPGQPDCSYFLKTGFCKFKSSCRYNHPKDRMSISSQTVLSSDGLPLRPGQIACSHYIRHGVCKFGAACKFDHPRESSSSFLPSVDGLATAGTTHPSGFIW